MSKISNTKIIYETDAYFDADVTLDNSKKVKIRVMKLSDFFERCRKAQNENTRYY